MKWKLALLLSFLAIPSVSAFGDLTIYAEASYKSQDSAPILVEHFHGEGDDEHFTDLKKLDSEGEISLINWWTEPGENNQWPSDDAYSRAMFHEIETFPSNVVNGEIINTITPREIQNDISIDSNIQLIGSTEVELINITATWTNPANLQSLTQIHLFIIEKNAEDSSGRITHNLLRDWAPSSSFIFTNNSTNYWNSTITRDHLDGAGINLNDASHANEYEIMIVMIGAFEGEEGVRTLSLQRNDMPTKWQSATSSDYLAPALLLVALIVIIFFVVKAEYNREKGLPRLEGNWVNKDTIEYRITAGNSLKILEFKLDENWKASSGIKRERISAGEMKSGEMKLTGAGILQIKLSVDVEDLGEWTLDLNLPANPSND